MGIAFRLNREPLRFEYVYLPPTNSRSNDELRRNHTTPYGAFPEFPWHRLRRESPVLYESYVDLEAGAWSRVKILLRGTEAAWYVRGTEQPRLIVKAGESVRPAETKPDPKPATSYGGTES